MSKDYHNRALRKTSEQKHKTCYIGGICTNVLIILVNNRWPLEEASCCMHIDHRHTSSASSVNVPHNNSTNKPDGNSSIFREGEIGEKCWFCEIIAEASAIAPIFPIRNLFPRARTVEKNPDMFATHVADQEPENIVFQISHGYTDWSRHNIWSWVRSRW